MAIRDAFMWVASGFYDIVLVGGVEKAGSMGTAMATVIGTTVCTVRADMVVWAPCVDMAT